MDSELPQSDQDDREPPDDKPPPPPQQQQNQHNPALYNALDTALDSALRLVPQPLAVAAARVAASAPPFPLADDDINDVTADLTWTAQDLDLFIGDTQYIQLPDDPVSPNLPISLPDVPLPNPVDISDLTLHLSAPDPTAPAAVSAALPATGASSKTSPVAPQLSPSPNPSSSLSPSPLGPTPPVVADPPAAPSSKPAASSSSRRTRPCSSAKRPRPRAANPSIKQSPIKIAPRSAKTKPRPTVPSSRAAASSSDNPSVNPDTPSNDQVPSTHADPSAARSPPSAISRESGRTTGTAPHPVVAAPSVHMGPVPVPMPTPNLFPLLAANMYPFHPTLFPARPSPAVSDPSASDAGMVQATLKNNLPTQDTAASSTPASHPLPQITRHGPVGLQPSTTLSPSLVPVCSAGQSIPTTSAPMASPLTSSASTVAISQPGSTTVSQAPMHPSAPSFLSPGMHLLPPGVVYDPNLMPFMRMAPHYAAYAPVVGPVPQSAFPSGTPVATSTTPSVLPPGVIASFDPNNSSMTAPPAAPVATSSAIDSATSAPMVSSTAPLGVPTSVATAALSSERPSTSQVCIVQPPLNVHGVPDEAQPQLPRQTAARLERHPILGRLHLQNSPEEMTAATSSTRDDTSNVRADTANEITRTSGSTPTPSSNIAVPVTKVDHPLPTLPPRVIGVVSRQPKKRLVWTPELHERFVKAIETVGLNQAVPKTLVTIMNVEGLTTEHVKSHLQKYRNSLRKEAAEEAQSRNGTAAVTSAVRVGISNVAKTVSGSADCARSVKETKGNGTLISNAIPERYGKDVNSSKAGKENVKRDSVKDSRKQDAGLKMVNNKKDSIVPEKRVNVVVRNEAQTDFGTQREDGRGKSSCSPRAPGAVQPGARRANDVVTQARSTQIKEKQVDTRCGTDGDSCTAGDNGLKDCLSDTCGAKVKTGEMENGVTRKRQTTQIGTGRKKGGACVSTGNVQNVNKRNELMGSADTRGSKRSADWNNTRTTDHGERELELELMKERTLQMQLQLQMMVHRTIKLEKTFVQGQGEMGDTEISGGNEGSGLSGIGGERELRVGDEIDGGNSGGSRLMEHVGGTEVSQVKRKDGEELKRRCGRSADGEDGKSKKRRRSETSAGVGGGERVELSALRNDQLDLQKQLEVTTALLCKHMDTEIASDVGGGERRGLDEGTEDRCMEDVEVETGEQGVENDDDDGDDDGEAEEEEGGSAKGRNGPTGKSGGMTMKV